MTNWFLMAIGFIFFLVLFVLSFEIALVVLLMFLFLIALGFFLNLGLSLAFGYAITFPRVIGLGIILILVGLVTGGNINVGNEKVEVNT